MPPPGGRERRFGPPRWRSTSVGRRPAGDCERLRRPQPLLKYRLPSGRGATEQPDITSGGAGILTPRFWAMVVVTGVAADLLGALMMAILFNVEYAAFGYHSGSIGRETAIGRGDPVLPDVKYTRVPAGSDGPLPVPRLKASRPPWQRNSCVQRT